MNSTVSSSSNVSVNTSQPMSPQQSTANTFQSNVPIINQNTNQQRILDRDILNILYYLLKDNSNGCERFIQLTIEKVETFLSASISQTTYTSTLNRFWDTNQTSLGSIRCEMILIGMNLKIILKNTLNYFH